MLTRIAIVLTQSYDITVDIPEDVVKAGEAACINWARENNKLDLGDGKVISHQLVHVNPVDGFTNSHQPI